MGRERRCILDDAFRVLECDESILKALGCDIVGERVLRDERVILLLTELGRYEGKAVLCGCFTTLYSTVKVVRDKNYVMWIKDYIVVDSDLREKAYFHSPESVMILTKDHVILDANEATVRLTGLQREELVGMHCYNVMHEKEVPEHGCPLVE